MDGGSGPLRSQRPMARPSAPRQPEMVYQRPEEPVSMAENDRQLRTVSNKTQANEGDTSSKSRRLPLMLVGIVLLVALAIAGYFATQKMFGGAPGIDSNKYQAVFFTNGLVYYGKLSSVDSRYLKLTNVYYIQTPQTDSSDGTTKNETQTTNDTSQSKLVKMGSEVYGPDGEITIARDQVLYYTNLKSDSKVSQLIKSNN